MNIPIWQSPVSHDLPAVIDHNWLHKREPRSGQDLVANIHHRSHFPQEGMEDGSLTIRCCSYHLSARIYEKPVAAWIGTDRAEIRYGPSLLPDERVMRAKC